MKPVKTQSGRFDVWRSLPGELVERAAGADPADVSAVARLRKSYDAASVAAALELAAARRKAVAKFPDRAATIWADVPGIEQATSHAVAAHKADRFVACGFAQCTVFDLCCGIGGDALALPAAVGVDRDPLKAWMFGRNTDHPAVAANVADVSLRGELFHLDPARRNKRGRVWRLEDYQPGPDFITTLLRDNPTGAIKLGPGVVPGSGDALPWPGEIEWISDRGSLVQAVLWTGDLARHDRSATLINDAGAVTLHGGPGRPPVAQMGRYVFAVDPSLERAELMHTLGLPIVHPKLGLLTSDDPHPDGGDPWLSAFEVVEPDLPVRKIKPWLAAHDGGLVEVKTRGKAAEPDRLQREWRGDGSTPYTVFVLRWDDRVRATVTRRL